MRARDTTEKAAAIHAGLNRAMGPERRFCAAMELSDFVRELAKAGLRSRHPEYTEAAVMRELMRQLYGDLPQRR
jgi:hypothetical protein